MTYSPAAPLSSSSSESIRIINCRDVDGGWFELSLEGARIAALTPQSAPISEPAATPLMALEDASSTRGVFDAAGLTLLPAGIDAHVHSRDPGLTHKETWQTLAAGAFRGGVTAVCDMPNTLPPTLTREAVLAKAELAAASGVRFGLLLGVGAANIARVADLLSDPKLPVCGLKVFYGKTTGELVYDDLETLARSLPEDGRKLIVFHSEDQCTIDCNHGRLAERLSGQSHEAFQVHSEIRSSAAAHASTRVILDWARDSYRRPIHIAHVSTPLEVELVADMRAAGVPVSCEIAPHHLLFSTDDYARLGPLVKMNPPLRSLGEVEALRRLFGAGAIEVFATDHAPHTLAEKKVEVGRSPSGVPALELYYPLLFACADAFGLPRRNALAMATTNPARLFGFPELGRLAPGAPADFTVISEAPSMVRGEEVVSKCGWTPYDGMMLPCSVLATWSRGRRVYPHGTAHDRKPG